MTNPADPNPQAANLPQTQTGLSSRSADPAIDHAGQGLAADRVTLESIEVSAWAGPLPRPDDLQKYATIDPSFPSRILKLTEDEAKHRRALEARLTDASVADQQAERVEKRIGQIFALTITLAAFASGVWVTVAGHPAVGGIVMGGTLVSLVYAFLKSYNASKESHPDQTDAPATPPPGGPDTP